MGIWRTSSTAVDACHRPKTKKIYLNRWFMVDFNKSSAPSYKTFWRLRSRSLRKLSPFLLVNFCLLLFMPLFQPPLLLVFVFLFFSIVKGVIYFPRKHFFSLKSKRSLSFFPYCDALISFAVASLNFNDFRNQWPTHNWTTRPHYVWVAKCPPKGWRQHWNLWDPFAKMQRPPQCVFNINVGDLWVLGDYFFRIHVDAEFSSLYTVGYR